MNKQLSECFGQLEQSNRARQEAYRAIYEEIERLAPLVKGDPIARDALIREVYWHPFDLPPSFITDHFPITAQSLRHHTGPSTIAVSCADCAHRYEMEVRSRRHRDEERDRLHLCGECRAERERVEDEWKRREREWLESEERQQRRLAELKRMRYADYLQTEEWRAIRVRALAAAGYRCAVCNAPDRLDVHHRTYERRGCEQLDDLTVLCRVCHEVFHENRTINRIR